VERQNVVSREYKVMLRPRVFAGDEAALLAKASSLWRDVSGAIDKHVLANSGDFAGIKTRRNVSFLDTRDHLFNSARYIFRERRELEDGKREMTLKFRHPDRFLGQARDMRAPGVAKAKTKFEEDIKAPFVSFYSFSTTIGVDNDKKWSSVNDVFDVFPDLSERVEGGNRSDRLKTVKDFVARELVLVGPTTQIGKTPPVDVEWGLIVWNEEHGDHRRPATVELSYRYGDKNEGYGGGVARRALDMFNALQSAELKRWVDPKPRTKTAFVYE
jgi:hypothetical protein